jgi:uncharacterized ferritin-like protein (DUF455 family)
MWYNPLMNFYDKCGQALRSSDVDTKSDIIDELLEYCTTNEVVAPQSFEPLIFDEPSYCSFCQIVAPRELPSRKDFHTSGGLATLVHSITHIEFSAIDLALDAVYRFANMPLEYKTDWLVVAQDEVRHYRMLLGILRDLGFGYGDFPVHKGLFEMSMKTAGDVMDRMAVIPRHFEAGGLDVNPQIAKKLERYRNNPPVSTIIDALKVIEDEEIDHVRKGDRWFRYICQGRNLDVSETFMVILERYHLLARHRPHMNIEARREAGFSCDELLELGADSCE